MQAISYSDIHLLDRIPQSFFQCVSYNGNQPLPTLTYNNGKIDTTMAKEAGINLESQTHKIAYSYCGTTKQSIVIQHWNIWLEPSIQEARNRDMTLTSVVLLCLRHHIVYPRKAHLLVMTCYHLPYFIQFNLLAPRKFEWNLKVMFKLNYAIDGQGISGKIALRCLSLDWTHVYAMWAEI